MADLSAEPGDYYEILGVVHTATPKDIETAFRNLARKWHPDVCADVHQAAANFKRIVEAYEVLSDPGKRRRYDESKQRRRRRNVSVPITRPHRTQQVGPGGGFGTEVPFDPFGGLESILRSLFGGGWVGLAGPAARPRPELNVEAELLLTPEEAHGGGPVQFQLRFEQACPPCGGRGTNAGVVCGTCGGKGRIEQGPRIVTLQVPPGVCSGSVIRVPGQGKSPPHAGPPGDLILHVRVQPCW